METTIRDFSKTMIDARVFYRKRGDIKYISHLDMVRLMQRALARAKLPAWFTQGFNPHLYLTFAQPLSLGFESDCETMDLRLTEEPDWDEAARRLGAQMPAGLVVERMARPVMDVGAITSSDYDIALETEEPDRALCALRALMAGAVLVEKKTKKGMRTVDIAPLCALLGEGETAPGEARFSVRCASGGESNVNPSLLVRALCARTGDDPRDVRVLKTAVRTADGERFR